jgi:hypothetical protein
MLGEEGMIPFLQAIASEGRAFSIEIFQSITLLKP